jgi:hypothetical protein
MTKPTVTSIKAAGWTGLWIDGEPGWFTTTHLRNGRRDGQLTSNVNAKGHPFYRCKITVRLLKDKRGRFIVRRAPSGERGGGK